MKIAITVVWICYAAFLVVLFGSCSYRESTSLMAAVLMGFFVTGAATAATIEGVHERQRLLQQGIKASN